MRRRWLLIAALAVAGCGELGSPRGTVQLSIVPVFDAAGAFADNADQLHVVLRRVSDSVLVKDTVLSIDATTGTADASLSVLIFTNPQQFFVALEAIRSSDGAVLFSGQSIVSVSSSSGGSGGVQVPVSYSGPKGTQVRIAPRDTAIAAGTAFVFRATVTDANGTTVAAPVTYTLASASDSVTLKVNRITGAAVSAAGANARVFVIANSPDNLKDTTSVAVGSVVSTPPAGVQVTPGLAAVAAGSTTPLTGVVIDGTGATIASIPVSWTSRSTGVATVNSSGVVTGVATGTAVVVAQGGGFADSTRVVVPPAGNVIASTTAGAGTRTFQSQKVGDTVTVTLTADMRFTPNEKLGSHGDTLTWNPALLQFIDVQPGPVFAPPTVNSSGAASGRLILAGADASSNTVGQVVFAKVRFKALAAGNASTVLTFDEMSGQLVGGTSTNFFATNRITVINGTITIVP